MQRVFTWVKGGEAKKTESAVVPSNGARQSLVSDTMALAVGKVAIGLADAHTRLV